MKTNSRILSGMAMVICLLFMGSSLQATLVQSVKDGNWSDGTVWSTGTPPGAGDDIQVRNRVTRTSNLVLNDQGRITVESGGHLRILGPIENYGIIINHDSLSFTGNYDNWGILENYSEMVIVGNVDNHHLGAMSNFGTIHLTGNLDNNWKFQNEAYCYITGNFDNYIVTESLGQPGYFEVCGDVIHHGGGTVIGTIYLCLRCGGSYDAEPGHNGEFILQCTPFAATLTEFKAQVVQGIIVNLSWTTQSESNCAWFVIERSSSANTRECKVGKCGSFGSFVEIGKVQASGNSQTERNYTFQDTKPLAGQNYYRLRIVDGNGISGYSAIEAVEVKGQGSVKLIAYPNPNNSILHIQATGVPGEPAVLTLYSVDGKQVWERKLAMGETTYRFDIPVCDFAAGIYLLKLQQGSTEEVRKLIFEK